MALLTHLPQDTTENKRRQATARRPTDAADKAPHIEQARIDYMALHAITWQRIIAHIGHKRRLPCRRSVVCRLPLPQVVYRQAPLSPPVLPTAHKSAADLANGRRRLDGVWGGVLLCADRKPQAA